MVSIIGFLKNKVFGDTSGKEQRTVQTREEQEKNELLAQEKLRKIQLKEEQKELQNKLKRGFERWTAYEQHIKDGWKGIKAPQQTVAVSTLNNVLPFSTRKEAADYFSSFLKQEVPEKDIQVGTFTDYEFPYASMSLVYRFQEHIIFFTGDKILKKKANYGKLVHSNAFTVRRPTMQIQGNSPYHSDILSPYCDSYVRFTAHLKFSDNEGLQVISCAVTGPVQKWEGNAYIKEETRDMCYPNEVPFSLFLKNLRAVIAQF